MIAAWMLYCSLCALGLAVAALLAERAMLAGGGPVRHVWVAALVLAVVIPVVAFRYAPRTTEAVSSSVIDAGVRAAAPLDTAFAPPSTVARTVSAPRTWDWRATIGVLRRANQPLAVAWAALSAGLAAYLFFGVVALAWMRRRWQVRDVLGVSVLVSKRTGPAVIGAMSPAIVMPEWALAMETHQLALMLRHEEEHRRARDVQLMIAAQLVLVIMPWNAALWWLVVRLGMAVELDCDARVLRDADARSYGALLLEVARPRRGPRFVGVTAFAERAGQLERRIRAIARRRKDASRGARAVVAFIALAAIAVACMGPRPAVPVQRPMGRPALSIVVPTDTPIVRQVSKGAKLEAPVLRQRLPDTAPRADVPARVRTALKGDTTVFSAVAKLIRGDTVLNVNVSGVMSPPSADQLVQRMARLESPRMVDSVFSRLFERLAVTAEQEAKAREIIAAIEAKQIAAASPAAMATQLRSITERLALQARRDSALRALIDNDVDRVLFDVRSATQHGGARGRSGSGSPPSGGAGGGPGGARGGRGARGGSPPNGASAVDVLFQLLFDGITLTPDREMTARAIIGAAQAEIVATILPPPTVYLALLPGGSVMMQAESGALLAGVLTNDADRGVLLARIVTARPPVATPPT